MIKYDVSKKLHTFITVIIILKFIVIQIIKQLYKNQRKKMKGEV